MDHAHLVVESSSSLTGIPQQPGLAIANDTVSSDIKLDCKGIEQQSSLDNVYADSASFSFETLNSDIENKCKITSETTNSELPSEVITNSICDTSSSPCTPDESLWTSYINNVNSNETKASIVEIELTEMKQRKTLLDGPTQLSSTAQDETASAAEENSSAAIGISLKSWTVAPINSTESVKHKSRNQDNIVNDSTQDEVSYGNPAVLTFSSKSSNSAQNISSASDRHKLNIGSKAFASFVTEPDLKAFIIDEKLQRKKKFQDLSECTKPTYAMDINGNLCQARNGSFSLVTSSSSKYDPGRNLIYSGQSLKPDTVYRKTKKTRTENQNFILSENIAGHKGEVEIDELLNFIQSSDKKGKAPNKVASMTSAQASLGSKLSSGSKTTVSEIEKKKSFPKDVNNVSSRRLDSTNKEAVDLSDEGKQNFCQSEYQIETINHRSISDFPSLPRLVSENTCSDWSSRVEDEEQKGSIPLSPDIDSNSATLSDDASLCRSDKLENEISSFVHDFYAVTDPEQQTEETEFRVVAKKQRKRQPKRLDSYRHYNNSASNSDGNEQYHTINQRMHNTRMFLANTSASHRSHLRRLESLRRKSTSSSMPPSEQSSADNSDLDSVHSLPVGKSNANTCLTPQASYADIARMPTAILHKARCSSPHTYSTTNQALEKDENAEIDYQQNEDIDGTSAKDYGLENAAYNDSSSDQNSDVNNSVSSLVVLDAVSLEGSKEPIECLPIDAEKMQPSCVHNMSTDSVAETADSLEFSVLNCSSVPPADKKTSPCSNSNSGDSCEIPGGNTRNVLIRHKSVSSTKHLPAVVIMDNCLPSGNLCGVSFGFDIDEVLKHGAGTIPSCTFVDEDKENSELLSSENNPTDNKKQPIELVKRAEVMYIGHSHPKCAQTASVQKETGDFSVSSPFVINGRCLIWKDNATDINSFNYAKTVGFLDNAWREVLQDYQQKSTESRVKYYSNL